MGKPILFNTVTKKVYDKLSDKKKAAKNYIVVDEDTKEEKVLYKGKEFGGGNEFTFEASEQNIIEELEEGDLPVELSSLDGVYEITNCDIEKAFEILSSNKKIYANLFTQGGNMISAANILLNQTMCGPQGEIKAFMGAGFMMDPEHGTLLNISVTSDTAGEKLYLCIPKESQEG